MLTPNTSQDVVAIRADGIQPQWGHFPMPDEELLPWNTKHSQHCHFVECSESVRQPRPVSTARLNSYIIVNCQFKKRHLINQLLIDAAYTCIHTCIYTIHTCIYMHYIPIIISTALCYVWTLKCGPVWPNQAAEQKRSQHHLI